MGLEVLVSSVISILIPYISAGAKKAAEVAGEGAAKTAGELLSTLKRWFTGDGEAEEVLSNFKKRPSLYGEAMGSVLQKKAEASPEMHGQLEKIIEAGGSVVDILQDMRRLAGEAVGVDLAKWEKISARVT